MNAFGIALIGLDHWYTAFGFAETAAGAAGARLIGVAEPDPERRAYIAAKHPQIPVTDAADNLMTRDDVFLVALCVPTGQAPALAKRALAAGKHVLSVKPPARSLAELDEVIGVARASGRFYGSFEGMQRMGHRARLLRDLIQGGAIGTPVAFHQVAHGGLPSPWPGQTGDSWWLHAEQVPGGAWIDHAIYAVDLARFVFGGEIVRAAGLIENRVHTELTVEDYGAALMRLVPAGGAPGVTLFFEDAWTASPGGGTSRQQIIGTGGSLRPDGSDWVVTRDGKETRHPIPAGPFFPVEALVEALRSGESLPFGPEEARANLAACLSVYDAA